VLALPQGHPLAAAKRVSARELHEVPLITFNTTLPIGAALASAFAESRATRRLGIEVGQAFIAAALVNANAGIGIVDELALGAVPPGLVVKPFEPKRVVRLYAVTRPERPSLIARSFLDTVAALARERRGKGLRAR
jgi:DNA-binding transcriptional LysR family regulator